MKLAKQPVDEARRLEILRQYDSPDLSAEPLDDLTTLAAHLCQTPISLISLIGKDRQSPKSAFGFPAAEISRDISFCAHTILGSDLLIVADTARDDRFLDNPLVTADPEIRFYAGIPLLTPEGHALGTLCVMDRIPRALSPFQQEAFRMLARQAMCQLELHRQSHELAESEARLFKVFRSCPVALSIHRWSDRTFVDINNAFSNLTGWTREEVFGRTSIELNIVEPDAAAQVRAQLGEHQALHNAEIEICTRNGEARNIIIGTELIELRGEKHALTTFVDITGRKAAEQALRKSEERLQIVTENARVGLVMINRERRYTFANATYAEILDLPSPYIVGLRVEDVLAPLYEDQIRRRLDRAFSGERVTYELHRPSPDGERQYAVRYEPTGTDPVVSHVVVVVTDITDQNQIETALRASEGRYHTLFEYAPDGIVIADSQSYYLDANAGMCRMLGYTYDELVGLHASDIVSPAETTHIEPALSAIQARSDYHREWQFRRKDGSIFSADVIATMMPDGNLIAMIRDITERKKLEQQFLRAQRMESVGSLAGGIAHDLNNVLAPILMSVEMLKEMVNGEDGLALLGTLQASAQRGADLVQQVLSFARGVKGQRVTVDLSELMRDLLNVIRDTFPKSIDMQFASAAELWPVTGDPTQLHQVLLNLSVNARDAMPNGGNLAIFMENIVLDDTYASMNVDAHSGAYVMVKVADTGTGIPAEIRDKIFDPFFTTKVAGQGTGLGLSTTLAIVKSHGGFIHLYSEPGNGTKFKIYLPANTSPAASDQAAVAQTGLPLGKGECVLVVDDEAAIRDIARRTLERFGYRVLLASHGAEAVSLYAQNKQDIAVVLTDMAMPIMDGPALIIALKSINPQIRIIGSSGMASNSGVAKAIGAGMQHFIPKPYTAEAMLKVLDLVLHGEEDHKPE